MSNPAKRPRMVSTSSRMGLEEDKRSNGSIMNHSPQPLCIQFKRWGNCSYGHNCRYAHVTNTGPNWKGHGGFEEDQRNVCKMKPCYFYLSGKGCPYGNKCIYLHEYDQKVEGGSTVICRENSAISVGISGKQVRNMTSIEPKRCVDLSKKFVKTRLCIQWERSGSCKYGSYCHFAHGKAELQSPGSSNPLKSLSSGGISAPAKSAEPDKTGFSALSKGRFLFKWTNIHKNSEIYGDWIEKVQLVPLSSNTVED